MCPVIAKWYVYQTASGIIAMHSGKRCLYRAVRDEPSGNEGELLTRSNSDKKRANTNAMAVSFARHAKTRAMTAGVRFSWSQRRSPHRQSAMAGRSACARLL